MKTISILLSVLLLTSSCSSNGQEYQTNVVDLKTISFELDAETFYRNSLNQDNLKFSSNKQFVEVSDIDNGWVEYNVRKSSNADCVAKFNDTKFAVINSITTKEGKLLIINTEAYLTPPEVSKLYNSLVDNYAKSQKNTITKSISKINIYTHIWNIDNKIIEMVSIFNPENPETLENINSKIADKDLRIITERPKTILFICKKENYDQIKKAEMSFGNWNKLR